jgi:hypothetical protein
MLWLMHWRAKARPTHRPCRVGFSPPRTHTRYDGGLKPAPRGLAAQGLKGLLA